MTSTTVSQHTSQPLNFGPEWLRALSTPDSATSIPSSGGSGSGNIFKFSATKYRYSKDEILALRVNVSERLSEEIQNEILENLKDVESVFRPNILDPLALTAPTSEELTKMNALSSYISGRTPGGAGRAGNNSQQSQQDSRNTRGGSSMSNGRGGGGGGSSRGRGGRDNAYGSNRGNNNNNSDDNGENGNAGDETSAQSSSWSRTHHSRGGSFGNRIRSYDDRDQAQPFRRGTQRQVSDGWRRSRGDDDDNNEQGDDSSGPVNGSSSWATRGGPARRGSSSNGSMEQRTKSSDKWSHSDERAGSSGNYESGQQRGGGGWRTNSSMSDRDLNSRRPQPKRDRMPEWMDDNNDDDNHLNNATFDQDGTYTRSSTARSSNDETQQQKSQSQSTSDESLSQTKPAPAQQEEEIKPEKPAQPVDTPITNVPAPSEPAVPQPKPLVQQTIPSWDDDFDQSDFAATVVEATLADDHDYSPPISAKPTPRLIPMEPTPVTAPIIPQQRTPVIIDDKQWFYRDPQNTVQGPFSAADMERWFTAGYFTVNLPVKRLGETQFSTIQQLTKELGRLPFRTDVPSHPTTPVHKQQQQPIAPEPQKFNPLAYVSSSTSNNPFDDFSMQQQQQQQQQTRQNAQHSLLFNRQTSMPLSTNDRKPMPSSSSMSSQLQAYFNSQQQSSSSSPLFSSTLSNDPAIAYQQQIQRSMSTTNQPQQQSNSALYDEMQRTFRQLSSQNNNSSFYPSNASLPQQQQQQQQQQPSSSDIMSRLTQAMQTRGKEQHRVEQQQRHDFELERMKMYQQAEQTRLQRDEEERRKYKLQQEAASNRQSNLDQLTKSMENKKQSSMEIDSFIALQQLQYQKEQAKMDAQAENMRRLQQQYREQSMYQNNWNQPSTDIKQSLNFADIQKQEQEQDRRSREAAAFAHQYPKSRSATNQQSTPWNGSNAAFQDIQRQQSTPASGWGSNFQQPSSGFYWDSQHPTAKPTTTPWTELKPTSPSTVTAKPAPMTNEPPKDLSTNTRTQDALSKWTQNQFKETSKDIDVPTLVQLLKDINNPGEIMEYVQPYIGSVSKAKEFASDFLAKRNQLLRAEPDLDNDRLNELAMAPTSSNDNSISGGDEGFQLASSNGQKKKAKKMKGQKLDAKQLGFIVNNRPEQRDDIDKVPM